MLNVFNLAIETLPLVFVVSYKKLIVFKGLNSINIIRNVKTRNIVWSKYLQYSKKKVKRIEPKLLQLISKNTITPI